jgi:nucleotide-binding universal stress UspA family protein
VMSSRGKRGQFFLGSVAEKVVRHSPVPVLTVPVR